MICNRDCFHCPHPDCIADDDPPPRSESMIRAQKKYRSKRPQAMKDAQKRYYMKNRERLTAKMRERYYKMKERIV